MKHLSYMSLSVINDDPNTLDAICKALSAINGVRYEYSGSPSGWISVVIFREMPEGSMLEQMAINTGMAIAA